MTTPEGIEIKVGQVWRDTTRIACLRRIVSVHATYVNTEHPQRAGMAAKVAIRKLKAPSWVLEKEAE